MMYDSFSDQLINQTFRDPYFCLVNPLYPAPILTHLAEIRCAFSSGPLSSLLLCLTVALCASLRFLQSSALRSELGTVAMSTTPMSDMERLEALRAQNRRRAEEARLREEASRVSILDSSSGSGGIFLFQGENI